MTVSCVRCLNHKLDAISMEDYYALVGILESSRQVVQTLDLPGTITEQASQLQDLKVELHSQLAADWLAATETLAAKLLVAVSGKKVKGGQEAGNRLQQQFHQEKLGLDDFVLLLKRTADES